MEQPDSVELNRTDLAGWLMRLACRLRNDGLAMVGRASLVSSPGERDYEDLTEMWNSLERAASMLEAIKDRLCSDCQTMGISDSVIFDTVRKVCTSSPREGSRNKDEEEEKDRKADRRWKGRSR